MGTYTFVFIGFAIWLVAAMPIYGLLRRWMTRNSVSDARGFIFAVVFGTIVAPGIIGLGHPPPLPFPGAALLFPLYLIIAGGEDGYFFAIANLASWLGVTAFIMIVEGTKSSGSRMPKPSQIINAVRIMWILLIALFLRILGIAIMASKNFTVIELIQTLGILVIIGLLALLIRAVSMRRNWARLVYAVIAVIVILLGGFALFSTPEFDLTLGLVRVIVIAAFFLVLYLLFHPASNQWFRNNDVRAI